MRSEALIWSAVAGVSIFGVVSLVRGVPANDVPAQVGRRVAFPAEDLTKDRAPIEGDPRAKFTLVVFSDYQCGPCRDLQRTLRPLVAGGRFALVLRHFPLKEVHPFAERAARYALAEGDPPSARAIHESLETLLFSEDTWREWVGRHPLRRPKSPAAVAAELSADARLAERAAVDATPTLFLVSRGAVYEVQNPSALASL